MPAIKECPGYGRNGDAYIIAKAKEKLSENWTLIAVFFAAFLFCTWILVRNCVAVYSVFTEWKANVRANKQEKSRSLIQDVMDPAYDDEYYADTSDIMTKSDFNGNAAISKRLRDMRKAYSGYNKALQKSGKTEDAMDERILAEEHDSYENRLLKADEIPKLKEAAAASSKA